MAELDEATQRRLGSAEEDFYRYWASIPPPRRRLVANAAVVRKQFQHIERLVANELDDELAELLERKVPAVAVFERRREALAACRDRLPEIVERVHEGSFPGGEIDAFRVAWIKRLELLEAFIERVVGRANSEAHRDASRCLMSPGELDPSDTELMLRIAHNLSAKERELARRRAEARRDDAAPWTDAERSTFSRARKKANNQLARRRVT